MDVMLRKLAILVVVAVLAVGCAKPGTDVAEVGSGDGGADAEPAASGPGEVSGGNISGVKRNTEPDVADDDLARLVADNADFAFDLYAELRDGDGNVFFSPQSISACIAMVYAGARGRTEQEMADVLHYTLPGERLHASFNALDLLLASRENDELRLETANAIWSQRGFQVEQDFADLVFANYGAGLKPADFATDPDGEAERINAWAAENTNDKIKEVFKPGDLTPLTRMVLANAIYFKAAWAEKFAEGCTRALPFHLVDGETADVQTMYNDSDYRCAVTHGCQAVELPYRGGELAMLVVMPDDLAEFEAGLDRETVEAVVSALRTEEMELYMPKFTYETGYSLADTLSGMGMPTAFSDGGADFSGLHDPTSDGYGVHIARIIHKAFVLVDEAGTEAAAVTAVDVAENCCEPEPMVVRIDRPFLFFIRDIQTGTFLFVGRVTDPR